MDYTPGPWEIIQLPSMEYRIDAKVGPMHVCPAIAHGLSDARLISAAPDLYVALRAWVESTSRDEQTGSMRPVYDAAKAALFKVS